MSGRELLFSVTRKDCKWDYYRGSGAGGQHRNKTDSAVRCTHVASGAIGRSEDTRSQVQNKVTAFKRMAGTEQFKAWHKIEIARRMGRHIDVNGAVDRSMSDRNLRVDFKDEHGRWAAEVTGRDR